MNYCAVIGDLVASREIAKRGQVQTKLKKIINQVNNQYDQQLAAKLMIYAGDEIQGLLYTPAVSYKLIQDVKEKLQPLEIVFGVGVGELTTKLPSHPVTWELDGSAYHQARKMLKQAKKKKPSICYSFDQSIIKRTEVGEIINSLLYFIESNQANRTQRQQQVVQLYQQYQSQELTAQELEVTQVAVSKILNNAVYYQVQQAKTSLDHYLNSFT